MRDTRWLLLLLLAQLLTPDGRFHRLSALHGNPTTFAFYHLPVCLRACPSPISETRTKHNQSPYSTAKPYVPVYTQLAGIPNTNKTEPPHVPASTKTTKQTGCVYREGNPPGVRSSRPTSFQSLITSAVMLESSQAKSVHARSGRVFYAHLFSIRAS